MKHEPLFQVLTEIVEVICRRHLEDLRIFTENVNGVQTLVVMPHAADYPRLVGKHGGQVNAILYLVQRAAQRLNERIGFALRESFIGDREPVEAFAYNPDFNVATFHLRLERLAEIVSGHPWKFRVTPVGDILVVTTPCERNGQTETFLSALEAVMKPACYGSGRKLQIKPEFINHETNPELLRKR
jgi:predicted RNA-binding protein YlqC (UPF0109 family)